MRTTVRPGPPASIRSTPYPHTHPGACDAAHASLATRRYPVVSRPSHFLPPPHPDVIKPAVPRYSDVQQRMREAAQSADSRTRQQLLDFFSKEVSPALPTEEAVLQLLAMNFVYLYLQPRAQIDLSIRRNLEGKPVQDYAKRYNIEDLVVDNCGCVAYLLRPASWPSRWQKHRSVIAFRGTAHGPARDAMAVKHPTGLRADIDIDGVGHHAFAARRTHLCGWVRDCLDARQDVTLVGHSLGGALSALLMAALPPAQQARCRLITFNAPGIDVAGAQRIDPAADSVRICNRLDPITRAGARHPPARIYSYSERDRFHVRPHLAARQLEGDPLVWRGRQPRLSDQWQYLEPPRRLLGRLAFDHIEF